MKNHFDTLLIHSGEKPDPQTGAIAPILVRSKTYAQKFGVDQQYQYSRGLNPTRVQLEQKLADLEEAKYAVAFASGNAAVATFFQTLNPGDHVLCCQEVYGGTYRILDKVMSRFGITADYVDFSTKESIIKNIKPNTKWLFVETPTNPSLHIIDLKLVNDVSKQTGIPFVVDSTFAPPCSTKPLTYGAKVVIHSLSKYIAGHNDILGGALITNDEDLYSHFFFLFKTNGAILSPDESYRILQGIKTLSMRWKTVSESAYAISCDLECLYEGNKIKNLYYPNLKKRDYDIVLTQMKNGFGGVLSFELNEKYHSSDNLKKFVDTATEDGTITYAESLASPETILAYPALMSHKSLPIDIRNSLGITDGFFRLSLGFENLNDIRKSLIKALDSL